MSAILLSDAVEQYLVYRRATYSKGTVLAASQTLRQFLAVVGNVQVKSLGPQHAERFQTKLLSEGKKPNTVNSRMSQLSTFSRWAMTHRYLPAMFVGTTRNIPVPARKRLRVPAQDFERLLSLAERPDRRITIALGLYLFLRGGEMRTLRVGDVDLDLGTIAVTIHKTNGFDEMPVCWELDQEMRRWFTAYAQDIGRPLRNTDFLVPSHRRFPGWLPRPETGNYQPERMQLRPFQQVQNVLDASGYPIMDGDRKAGEGMHTLRRSGARALYEALVDGRLGDNAARDDALRQVMAMLHHSSIVITEAYIGLERDRQKRDTILRGKRMFEPTSNVTQLREVSA